MLGDGVAVDVGEGVMLGDGVAVDVGFGVAVDLGVFFGAAKPVLACKKSNKTTVSKINFDKKNFLFICIPPIPNCFII
jgi:hypothetical protein